MFYKHILLLSVGLVALDAQAEYLTVARNNEASAYKVEQISETEFKNDKTGNVFSDYSRGGNGELVSHYYRYVVNGGKGYSQEESKAGSGNNEDVIYDEKGAVVPVGQAVKVSNGDRLKHIDDVVYKDSTYQYEYKGGSDTGDVFLRGGIVFNEGLVGAKDSSGLFQGTAVEADFVNNKVTATESAVTGKKTGLHVEGGVLYNNGEIGVIDGDFVQNSAKIEAKSGGQLAGVIDGGVVNNEKKGYIKQFAGDFVGNNAQAENVKGGVILNLGKISSIDSNFVANTIQADVQANGAAIQNNDEFADIRSISGSFVGNKALSKSEAWGGAIDNAKGVIGEVTGEYNNNLAKAEGDGSWAIGGAISNQGVISKVSGNFVGNQAVADELAMGGAIYHDGSNTAENALYIVNSNFYNNSVQANGTAVGGAIYGNYVHIDTIGQNSEFRGNTANGKSNAIYMEGSLVGVTSDDEGQGVWDNAKLMLSAEENGALVFDDAIDGSHYDISVMGDGTGEVVFNSRVDNADSLYLGRQAMLHMGKDAELNVGDYTAENNARLKLDLAVDRENNSIENGMLNIAGDIKGETRVIVNSLNTDVLDDFDDAVTQFVAASNDDPTTESNFVVDRVIGSPYMWNAYRNHSWEEGDTVSNWYLALRDKTTTPEVPAYIAMQSATVEQNRGVTRRINDALRANRQRGCCDKKFAVKEAAWVDADYAYAEIDAPSEMKAKIKGVTGGFDFGANQYHRLGLFGAYRQGDYDLSGESTYLSLLGSKMDINSYMGGLYYSYDRNKWSVLATVFAGKQDIDVKTDDRVASADTSATQYGASLQLARRFYLSSAWLMEPSLSLYYTALDLDNFSDNVGKDIEFDLLHYMEAELGLRFERLFCIEGWTSKVYAKPSIIQTYANGAKTRITGLHQVETMDNQTLGRMEVGAKFGLTPRLSAYTSANYTFGSDYKSYGVDAGVTYAW